jgi:hypothetical protein
MSKKKFIATRNLKDWTRFIKSRGGKKKLQSTNRLGVVLEYCSTISVSKTQDM